MIVQSAMVAPKHTLADSSTRCRRLVRRAALPWRVVPGGSGARIHAPSVLGLPETVHLLIPRARLMVRSRRVWSDFPHFGLRFVHTETLEESADGKVVSLGAWSDWPRSTRA